MLYLLIATARHELQLDDPALRPAGRQRDRGADRPGLPAAPPTYMFCLSDHVLRASEYSDVHRAE